ncbi:MAG: molecular chaperone DnaJ [Thermodesulfobacteriota bacterium]
MEEKDYYRILSVSRDASAEDIKKAFRKLVHQYHPDKHKGDKGVEEKFKKINEAYEVLKDPRKRAQYDRFGYAGQGTGFGESGYGAADFGGDFQDLFGDVFSEFFGGRRRGPAAERGMDLRYDLDITFEEAAFGTEKSVKIPRAETCVDCRGSGAKPGTQPVTCPTCRGAGQVRFQQGFFAISKSCTACAGTGRVVRDPCPKCAGMGVVQAAKNITVKVPAGVDTGSRLRLAGEGEAGRRGGTPGDLYIVLNVLPHEFFKRHNDDIICEVPLGFPQAALGAEIEVPTLEGTTKLKIPPGTQPGKVFRLKHKGIASLHTGSRGDQQVVVRVETPTHLSDRQRELLSEFASISGAETYQKKNFFSKVKEIFE